MECALDAWARQWRRRGAAVFAEAEGGQAHEVLVPGRRIVDAVAARVRERACDRGLACVRAACRVSARGSEPLSGGSFGGQCGVQRPES